MYERHPFEQQHTGFFDAPAPHAATPGLTAEPATERRSHQLAGGHNEIARQGGGATAHDGVAPASDKPTPVHVARNHAHRRRRQPDLVFTPEEAEAAEAERAAGERAHRPSGATTEGEQETNERPTAADGEQSSDAVNTDRRPDMVITPEEVAEYDRSHMVITPEEVTAYERAHPAGARRRRPRPVPHFDLGPVGPTTPTPARGSLL